MKRNLLHIAALLMLATYSLSASAIDRDKLIEYAKSLKGLKKAELKTAIYKSCQPKKVLAYGSGSGNTWDGFYDTDRIAGTSECVNRYSSKKFYFTKRGSAISGMNIEHSFPKSWWGGASNNAYKDLFNLYPSESDANSSKSNYPMGKVTNPNILDDYEKVGSGPAGSLGNIRLCEPNDLWKGDFCRSYFYMATIYQNFNWSGTQGKQQLQDGDWPTLREWAYKLYLEWTRQDVVVDIEIQRNNAIYEIQGNRNLFIDYPYLAEYVWGDSINVAFDPYTSITTADGDDRYTARPITPVTPDNPEEPDEPDEPENPENPDNPDIPEDGSIIFCETFKSCSGTGANDGEWNGGIASEAFTAAKCDNNGWSATSTYGANGCIRLGTGSKQGSIVTPEIPCTVGMPLTLTFRAGAWNSTSEGTTLNIEGIGCTLSPSSVQLEKGQWNTYTVNVTCTQNPIQIKFIAANSSNNRFFLDDVTLIVNGESTDIHSFLKDVKQQDATFSLSGQQVEPSYKGIIFKNGKKFYNK